MPDQVHLLFVRTKLLAAYAEKSAAEAEAKRLRLKNPDLAVQPRLVEVRTVIVR